VHLALGFGHGLRGRAAPRHSTSRSRHTGTTSGPAGAASRPASNHPGCRATSKRSTARRSPCSAAMRTATPGASLRACRSVGQPSDDPGGHHLVGRTTGGDDACWRSAMSRASRGSSYLFDPGNRWSWPQNQWIPAAPPRRKSLGECFDLLAAALRDARALKPAMDQYALDKPFRSSVEQSLLVQTARHRRDRWKDPGLAPSTLARSSPRGHYGASPCRKRWPVASRRRLERVDRALDVCTGHAPVAATRGRRHVCSRGLRVRPWRCRASDAGRPSKPASWQ
jgi:hypothetical protein